MEILREIMSRGGCGMYTQGQQLLSSEQEDERCAGIDILVADGQNNSIELLATQFIREQSTFVRRRLIASLGAFQSPYVALIAGDLLTSPEAYVRNGALTIMQILGIVALPVLTELMSHQDCNLRKLAVDALDKIPGEISCSLLIGGLGDHDPNIVSTCAEALGNRRDVQIIPALTAALTGTENVWVAFAIMESMAKTSDHSILEVIEQYISKKIWNREQHVILAGVWAVTASQLGDERQLPAAWQLYHDKVLTIGQMLTLLDDFQGRGIELKQEEKAIAGMLAGFFADKLKKNSTHDMIAAIRIANRHCPTLLDDEWGPD